MKRILLLIFAALLASAPSFAQSPRIAFVDTNAFIQPERGIKRLLDALNNVERDFAPRRAELSDMQQRLQKLLEQFSYLGPIPTDPEPMTSERRTKLKEEAEQMKRNFELRQKAFDNAYDQRVRQTTAPIYKEIQHSLETFARTHNITMLLDASKSPCSAGDCSMMNRLDVTAEFIAEYNRLNP
jgi:Skp family chaperone for outer membrane proteins